MLKLAYKIICLAALLSLFAAPSLPALAQQEEVNAAADNENNQPEIKLKTEPYQDTLANHPKTFSLEINGLAPEEDIEEIVWNFGDGVRTTGQKISHTYKQPGSYLLQWAVSTNQARYEDTSKIRVFKHLIILVADSSATDDQVEIQRQQAAKEGVLLLPLKAPSGKPEVLVEEELTSKLLDIRDRLTDAHLIIMWTSGGVGANVLTIFAQHIRESKATPEQEASFSDKGIVLLSETPFTVLKPTAQSAFDQLHPNYVLLARPQAIDLIRTTTNAEDAKSAIMSSPLEYRLLGTFSARTVSDLGLTNFLSFGLNFLVNRGVPINSIVLILMLPIIATILASARQIIGISSFGLITPAMTTLSFLVMGLRYGLIVFFVILLAGTLTRSALRRLRLLYLPRMALVLTSVSLSLLLLLGLGVANDRSSVLSFSIFPALILTILAEEFIAAQFKLGVRSALTLTAWTLVLAMICYFIVSSEIFRTLILSYPEIILLTIPLNIALGKWRGLRLTEYFRFRELIRHTQ